MSTRYNFTKTGIAKPIAADDYFKKNFALYVDMSYADPDLSIDTLEPLDETTLAELQTLVDNYVDPDVFLVLKSTITDPANSKATSSTSPMVVQTFIFASRDTDGQGVLNSMKTVIEYSTPDVSTFAGEELLECTTTFQIYCYTRSVLLTSVDVNVDDILASWQTMANNSETGPRSVFRSIQIEGLRTLVTDYDCIWQYKLAVSNTDVTARAHGIQWLYYDLY